MRKRGTRGKWAKRHLRSLVEEAVVDCYTEDECIVGFLSAMQDSIPSPFPALVVGTEVTVLGFDLGPGEREIVALCKREGRRYRVGVEAIEWAGKPPDGAEWLAAYCGWKRGIL